MLDNSFSYRNDLEYHGYVGISVNRVKLIPMINLLKKQGVSVYSVPVNYKTDHYLSKENAFDIAKMHAKENGLVVNLDSNLVDNSNPIVWKFSAFSINEEKTGGVIMVDRLDGHIWSLDEFDTYMYDYNNYF
ncbi:hypothetical protein LIN78_05135 [Leeia sp. TBRC 13508]|uniref:Uncharacterized protein n=1 Tax=Leeia speluncae TaxID=2884804 RepID=A0ABS8D416_9NEIS|nr:hypothetical protein [Leeia speluncae]MCB6182930.1 hypothetical protein [Leeia speluncae]